MKKLNKIKLKEYNINELLNNYDDEMWYNLLEEDKLKFNKSGYYKIKCKDDSYIESIEYIGKEFNCNYDNVYCKVFGFKDGFEYLNVNVI